MALPGGKMREIVQNALKNWDAINYTDRKDTLGKGE